MPSFDMSSPLTVDHEALPTHGSFVLKRAGVRVGELDYSRDDEVLSIDHTRVDSALRGGGEGARLVAMAVDYARAEGLKVRPACSFARDLFSRRADWTALRA